MDIQKRVAASEIQRIHFCTLPRVSREHLSSRRSSPFSRVSLASLLRLSCPSLLPFVLRPQESTYGCSFGNHIFFVSQFAAPLNALPPFRRGCISVAAARYKFWLRAFDGVGGKVGQGEKRRRKIGPMVIDYLPRIPRIPYSDRPHGPKIEPSITGAPLSFSSLYPSPSSPFFSSFISSLANSPESVDALVYFLASRDEGYNSRLSETLLLIKHVALALTYKSIFLCATIYIRHRLRYMACLEIMKKEANQKEKI